MTIHRFHVPDLDRTGGMGRLTVDQSRQVSRVLRLHPGETICVFDGGGSEFEATLVEKSDRQWVIELGEERWPQREPRLRLTVGLALLRNERFDMALQKLTEMGVASIIPVAAERCVLSYADARSWEKRRARMHRIIVEAAEQSERTTLPELHSPQAVDEFLMHSTGMETFALVERQTTAHITSIEPRDGELALLIGPEGGWTDAEIAQIKQSAHCVSLGRLILRAETAAIAGAGYVLLSAGEVGVQDGV